MGTFYWRIFNKHSSGTGNVYDEYAVNVLKSDAVVGHVPREISRFF